MASVLAEDQQESTVADLLERLGDIPASRVRLHPPPGQATERDVLEIHARTDRLFELIDGVLVEKAMGFRESFLAVRIIMILGEFVERHRLGIVTGADGMLRLSARNVRIPDVAFVSWNQLPTRKVPTKPIPDLFPDLAIEVLSESNTRREMDRKREDYFRAGTRLIWQFNPERRIVEVYAAGRKPKVMDSTQKLDGGKVLPGFELSLAELFGSLDEQGPPAKRG